MLSLSKSSLVLAVVVALSGAAAADAQISYQDELANLRSPNVKTRVKAARALGKSQRREAIAPLTEALRDPEPQVREAIVLALRQFRDLEALDGLLTALGDEEMGIRKEAMEGVLELYGGVGSRRPVLGVFAAEKDPTETAPVTPPEPRVIQALEARLRDEEPSLRRRAAYGLGLLQDGSAVEALIQALPDLVLDVRLEVVQALGRLGGERAGEALVAALADSSNETRSRAMEALGRMRYKPSAKALLAIYETQKGKSESDKALAALSEIGAPEARGVFYQMMTNSSPARRMWAVEGLARMDEPGLVPGLTKDFLREPDTGVQLAYCFALARLGRPEFVDRLALSLGKPELRDRSRAYLVELGSPYLDQLVVYLSDPVVEVRKNMVSVLMEIEDPAAIPHLEPLLADPDPEVADRANRAISRLRDLQGTSPQPPR